MKVSSTRTLEGLKSVLKDPNSQGPDPVYIVLGEITEDRWENITVITSGNYQGEYPKTFGHYHGVDVNETYHLIEGDGVLLMQSKFLDGETWDTKKVKNVVLIKAKPGDEILIKPEWGHSWSNVGKGPLISFDNWRSGHSPSDYEVMEELQGMAYYLVEEDGEAKALPNPNYKDLPEPEWLTAQEFKEKYS